MARKTKDEIHIAALCESYDLEPKKVYKLTKFLLEGAKIGYASIIEPVRAMTADETLRDKQLRRRDFLDMMVKEELKSIDEQKRFIYKVLRSAWLWEKIV